MGEFLPLLTHPIPLHRLRLGYRVCFSTEMPDQMDELEDSAV